MNVIVDTSVWSLVLRRHRPLESPVWREWSELVRRGRVLMLGPVRQEVLSGMKSHEQFVTLRERLRAFTDVPLDTTHYERAAELFNQRRARGIQGSLTDFLICAVSLAEDAAVFSTDRDFERFGQALGVKLHRPTS